MKVFLFDTDKNPITLTDNLVFNNVINLEYFELVMSNKIQSEFLVKAKKVTPGKIMVTSVLQEIKSEAPYLKYHVE